MNTPVFQKGFHKDLTKWLDMRRRLQESSIHHSANTSEISYSKYRSQFYWRNELFKVVPSDQSDLSQTTVSSMHIQAREAIDCNSNSTLIKGISSGVLLASDTVDGYGKSLLHRAVIKGDFEKTRLLIQFNAGMHT